MMNVPVSNISGIKMSLSPILLTRKTSEKYILISEVVRSD